METERIESMLTQLINMVGSLRSGQEEMKRDIQQLKGEQQLMKQDIQQLKEEQQEIKKDIQQLKEEQLDVKVKLELLDQNTKSGFTTVLRKIKQMELDYDLTWQKTVENEREIARMKNQ